jgi:hypothetical protein
MVSDNTDIPSVFALSKMVRSIAKRVESENAGLSSDSALSRTLCGNSRGIQGELINFFDVTES